MHRGKQWLILIMSCFGSLGMLLLFYIVYGIGESEEMQHNAERPESLFVENAYLLSLEDGELTFAAGDRSLSYPVNEGEYTTLRDAIEKGTIADLTIEDDAVIGIVLKNQRVAADDWEYREQSIWLGEDAEYALHEAFAAYDGAMEQVITKEQLESYEEVVFYVKDGVVCGAIADASCVPNIRIFLSRDSGGKGRTSVALTANSESELTTPSGEKRTVEAGEKVRFSSGDVQVGESWVLQSDGAFAIEGTQTGVVYSNCIEVIAGADGLYLVNEVPLETYLYGVLPSEIPTTYEPEAQKAQAVCARTYAYAALSGYRYPELKAHLDDTTNSQVYNRIQPTDAVIQAVNETCGRVLMTDGKIAVTYYYSTSYGVGAAAEEIWNDSGREYLVTKLHSGFEDSSEVFASLLNEERREQLLGSIDLSDEEAFRVFLEENRLQMRLDTLTVEEELHTYDETYPWYRWSITASMDEWSEQINRQLAALDSSLKACTVYEGESAELGELTGIEVTKRGKSGVATEVTLSGTEGKVILKKQTVIRTVLAPLQQQIVCMDDSEVSGMSLLPSAYFYVEADADNIVLQGGGYGHGVGMSQNGANAMAVGGATYDSILAHYFDGTTQESIYLESRSS